MLKFLYHTQAEHGIQAAQLQLRTLLYTTCLWMCRLGQCFMKSANVKSGASMPAQVLQPSNTAFKQPLHKLPAVNGKGIPLGRSAAAKQPASTAANWQHDPRAPDAIVLNEQQWSAAAAKGASQVMPVVIDPYIAKKLRPHQSQGVQFLYECVMGLREANR